MRELTIVRHAKSSWAQPGLDDFDRPLNERGARDAPEMGRRLAARGRVPQRLLASPARRARETAEALALELGLSPEAIEPRRELYLASPRALLELLRALPETLERALLVGHNPGLTQLVQALALPELENLPTGGVVELDLEGAWSALAPEAVLAARLDRPKQPL